jgi:putative N6-adenine-specific DNA methylase
MEEDNIGRNKYLAKTFFGLEEVLAAELKAIGAEDIRVVKRAVHFRGDQQVLYRANYELRTALRILKPIGEFEAHNPDQLYKRTKRINWGNYMEADGSFSIDTIVNSPIFRHSKFAGLRVKDAIADHFRDRYGRRPNVKFEHQDMRLNVHINDRKVRLSLDASGDSLHKRGYRLAGAKAPLNEVLAAGIVMLSGWKGERPLVDPMCGSGTILIEAALLAANQSPQKHRKWFGFMNWKDFDEKLWRRVKREAQEREKEIQVSLYGSDLSNDSLRAAQENIRRARLDRHIRLRLKNFFAYKRPPAGPAFIITNPPYGDRIKEDDILDFYKRIGDSLKQNFTNYEAWIFSGNQAAFKRLGLRTSQRIPLYNGPIECRLHKYELY